ncbi:MAG: acyl-CoA desaturase [Actinomycetota bacterium]|nr:acyl-CoA desaturase [Actinomycetota bacterium]
MASMETTLRREDPAVDGAPGRELGADVQPVANETRDRIITGAITVIPFLLLFLAGWQVWNEILSWHDVVVFALLYIPCTLGITVGFHRLLTHRSFKTGRGVRAVFAAFGSAAIEGPVISWVSDHRKHHAFSDEEGDPHSPHVGHGDGVKGAFKGFFHAHVGWLFIHTQRGLKSRFAPDLIDDPVIRFIDRTFVLWAVLGLLIPFGLGWLIGGTVVAGLTGMLWGGAVRVFLLHHVTYSINSVCHMFGRRRFETEDESRNFAPLALLSAGESWHNNHHAFPTSAVHGLGRTQLDPSAGVIWTLEKLGLAWDVVRISPERQAAKAAEAAQAAA